ncbi:Cbb3-type cytochrome oxidase, subunit 1 [Galbibacter orientalis DSM 19592]|uniref:Cbb3-type cytochrome oxidase, subunit 1 n=2 Tax=Galbibacter TaxID=379068 RepID=I3C1X8_9FLAO|nr:cbb3-type cytochrome c oxidase subunit I [Galbibacter orientalis]EIJ37621.1 Cbb3-type cytochrome oxidase, subunit 1 [Galbibacter orientalis DSM 19592]
MVLAQEQTPDEVSLWSSPGVLITIVLIAIPMILGIIILTMKSYRIAKQIRNKETLKQAKILAEEIVRNKASLNPEQIAEKKRRLEYKLSNAELSGKQPAKDVRGLIQNPTNELINSFFARKSQPPKRPKIDKNLTKLVLWFLGSAIFWLLLGTSVGEYLGIKFLVPDADSVSWLSFGRLRPVHTNLVFWGWSSLAMLGLGYYTVPRVGNTSIASLKLGWYSLYFINASHIIGTISLMAGINNGGGEYREYIWPVMLLFVIGLMLSLFNYYKTVAIRKTKEIYISNWYIIAAVIFINIIAVVSYLPFWQDGLGETIIQGYYMHQAVGLWFMMFVLGLLYYFLPQQLNKPIYSYSLGILAFWTQILFYTLIGTHHFVFSSLPWWLQTVAIVGSVGMLIPVAAGTINFLMTFKGSWNKVASSYSLPFFLVGVIYYFTGSLQGTAEAFRFTNLLWHFTDFTIAHSHITMYGIITFTLFAGVYAIVPRLTGKEPTQLWVGAHFWMALVGLQFYTIPLMIGGTLKGLSWGDGEPFINSVVLMEPYWLWRAIGGTLMWLSHIVFAYNFYKMVRVEKEVDIHEVTLQLLQNDNKESEIEEDLKT